MKANSNPQTWYTIVKHVKNYYFFLIICELLTVRELLHGDSASIYGDMKG
jgi:hypothetical protein